MRNRVKQFYHPITQLFEYFVQWFGLRQNFSVSIARAGMKQKILGIHHAFSYFRGVLRGNFADSENIVDFRSGSTQAPVLLVHGFLGTKGAMFVLKQRLLADGIHSFSVDLGLLNIHDIRTSAFLLYRRIELLLEQTKQERIDIIGHSMGGLIALYYILHLGGQTRVRRLIMLGSPIRGTWNALWGIGLLGLFCDSVWQLLPGSKLLKELLTHTLPKEVEIFTIAATKDRICPLKSTYLDGAHRFLVPLGHSSLVLSEEVYAKIQEILKIESPDRLGVPQVEKFRRS